MDGKREPDDRPLDEAELERVSGGADAINFPLIAEQFARANGCSACRQKNIYGSHDICLAEYVRLLNDYSRGDRVEMACLRRE